MCPVCDCDDGEGCIDGIFNALEGYLDWAIVCQEIGPMSRPFNPAWIIDLLEEGQSHKVPIHYKGNINGRRRNRGRGDLPVLGT